MLNNAFNCKTIYDDIFNHLQKLAKQVEDLDERESYQHQITSSLSEYPKQSLIEIEDTLNQTYQKKENKEEIIATLAYYLMHLLEGSQPCNFLPPDEEASLDLSSYETATGDLSEELWVLYNALYQPECLFPVHLRNRIKYFMPDEREQYTIYLNGENVTALITAFNRARLLEPLINNQRLIEEYVKQRKNIAQSEYAILASFNQAWIAEQWQLISNVHASLSKPGFLSQFRLSLSQFYDAPSQYPKLLGVLNGALMIGAMHFYAFPLGIAAGLSLITAFSTFGACKIRTAIFKSAYQRYQTSPQDKSSQVFLDGVAASKSYLSYFASVARCRDWGNYPIFGAGMIQGYDDLQQNRNKKRY